MSFLQRKERTMSVRFAVITTDPGSVNGIQVGTEVMIPTLSTDQADAVAVQVDELIRSITETVGKSISEDADLTVEISGGITLSAKGGVKWLFFNIGGEAKTTDTLKVVVKTKLKPQDG